MNNEMCFVIFRVRHIYIYIYI